jgi:hypothetical protein
MFSSFSPDFSDNCAIFPNSLENKVLLLAFSAGG